VAPPAPCDAAGVRANDGRSGMSDVPEGDPSARIRALEATLAARAAELEVANRELEAFSYAVSHDLRSPLRSIDGFSHALLEDLADRLDEPSRQHLARIRAAAQRMGAVIEHLQGLAEVVRAPLEREPVDLAALGRAIVAGLRAAEPHRSVVCTIHDVPPATGDRRLIRAALDNLLGNAWKFTARTTPGTIELGGEVAGGEAVYFVRDDGAGFEPLLADRLFAPFQRLHTHAQFPGAGIGLATVERIVRRHGGRIWAEGQTGRGATFRFTLG
jgi:light-regulated signal transduction histidine kinase (bacteriophytochrome)